MDTVKVTFEKLQEINGVVGEMYTKNPELEKGKFGYAFKRFTEKNLKTPFKLFNQELADLRIEHAATDPKTKAIIYDKESKRGYAYDKAGLQALIKAERELDKVWEDKEFDVIPYISVEKPELTEIEEELLTGLLV